MKNFGTLFNLLFLNCLFRYEPNNEPIARDGIHEGLSILIDSHDDWIGSSTVDEDHKGFVGYVSSGVNFPLTAKKGFHILGKYVLGVQV